MMTIKAKIHAAHAAGEEARIQLTAATAHLDARDLRAVDAHLALAEGAFDRARNLVIGGRRRAEMLDGRVPVDDGPHADPTSPEYDWSASEEAARADWSANEEAARAGV